MTESTVEIDRERDMVTLNIREGNQVRFLDLPLEAAKELLYKLQATDLSEEERLNG